MTDDDDTLLDELRGVFAGADPVPAAVSGAARALHVWDDEVCGHALLRSTTVPGAPRIPKEPEPT